MGARASSSPLLGGMIVSLVATMAACGSPSAPADAGPTASTAGAEASAPSGSGAASATPPSPFGPLPSAARRNTPPPGIDARAAAAGTRAPAFTLPAVGKPGTSLASTWSLTEGLTKHERVIVVFYRGAW